MEAKFYFANNRRIVLPGAFHINMTLGYRGESLTSLPFQDITVRCRLFLLDGDVKSRNACSQGTRRNITSSRLVHPRILQLEQYASSVISDEMMDRFPRDLDALVEQ